MIDNSTVSTDSKLGGFGFNTPFEEQIKYLQQKLRLPTERWDDITGRAHDRAFIVAGAAKADLLADLHAELARRATDGKGLEAFRKEFKAIVAKHGWTGWTGEGTKEGEAWRTRIIYQTNMATSYAAGRYAQMSDPEVLKLHPYWRYIHSDGVLNPRQQHLNWHGLTLLASHPFWQTHFAPNGFGCQCRITSVTRREGEASARAGLGDPPADWDKIDGKTGEQEGIGKGFGYAPGANVNASLQSLVNDKLMRLSPELALALRQEAATMLGSPLPQTMISPKSVDDFIKAGRAITDKLPDGAADPRACHQALLDLLQKEVGIATPCKVASSGEGAKLVKQASQLYPDSWTDAADALGTLYVRVEKAQSARGWQWTETKNAAVKLPSFGTVRNVQPGTGWIVTSQNLGTAVHEYAHRLQAALAPIDQLFQDLHKQRTAGEPLEKLNVITAIKYKDNELARKDKYINPYQGKEYSHVPNAPALEVMTMAFQHVLGLSNTSQSRLDFQRIYREDRGMFDLVVGLLRHWKP